MDSSIADWMSFVQDETKHATELAFRGRRPRTTPKHKSPRKRKVVVDVEDDNMLSITGRSQEIQPGKRPVSTRSSSIHKPGNTKSSSPITRAVKRSPVKKPRRRPTSSPKKRQPRSPPNSHRSPLKMTTAQLGFNFESTPDSAPHVTSAVPSSSKTTTTPKKKSLRARAALFLAPDLSDDEQREAQAYLDEISRQTEIDREAENKRREAMRQVLLDSKATVRRANQSTSNRMPGPVLRRDGVALSVNTSDQTEQYNLMSSEDGRLSASRIEYTASPRKQKTKRRTPPVYRLGEEEEKQPPNPYVVDDSKEREQPTQGINQTAFRRSLRSRHLDISDQLMRENVSSEGDSSESYDDDDNERKSSDVVVVPLKKPDPLLLPVARWREPARPRSSKITITAAENGAVHEVVPKKKKKAEVDAKALMAAHKERTMGPREPTTAEIVSLARAMRYRETSLQVKGFTALKALRRAAQDKKAALILARETIQKRQLKQAVNYSNRQTLLRFIKIWRLVYGERQFSKRTKAVQEQRADKVAALLQFKLKGQKEDTQASDTRDDKTTKKTTKKKKKKSVQTVSLATISSTPWDDTPPSRVSSLHDKKSALKDEETKNKAGPRWVTSKTGSNIHKESKPVSPRTQARMEKQRAKLVAQQQKRLALQEEERAREEEARQLAAQEDRARKLQLQHNKTALLRAKQLRKQQEALAVMHSARSLVLLRGWKPWRRALEQRQRLRGEMGVFYRFKLVAKTFRQWRDVISNDIETRKLTLAKHVLLTHFYAWQRYLRAELPGQMRQAHGVYCDRVMRRAFLDWAAIGRAGGQRRAVIMERKMLEAKSHSRVGCMKLHFKTWRHYTDRTAEQKRQATLAAVTKSKVQDWLHDFREQKRKDEGQTELATSTAAVPSVFGSVVTPLTLDELDAVPRRTVPKVPLYRVPAPTSIHDADVDVSSLASSDNNDDEPAMTSPVSWMAQEFAEDDDDEMLRLSYNGNSSQNTKKRTGGNKKKSKRSNKTVIRVPSVKRLD